MVQTVKPKEPQTRPYIVLRAICMHGERVEVGAVVQLDRYQAADAINANKVAPAPDAASAGPAPADKPKPVRRAQAAQEQAA